MRTLKRKARRKPRDPAKPNERSNWINGFLKKYGETRNLVESAQAAKVQPSVVILRRKNHELFAAQCEVAELEYEEGGRRMVNYFRRKKVPNLNFTLSQARATLPEWGRNEKGLVIKTDKVTLLPEELRARWRERLNV